MYTACIILGYTEKAFWYLTPKKFMAIYDTHIFIEKSKNEAIKKAKQKARPNKKIPWWEQPKVPIDKI